MSTVKKDRPSYITNAKFISEEDDVDDEFWPRDPTYYIKTQAWQERLQKLLGHISHDQVLSTIKDGKLYSSISNSVTFVKEIDGVVLYVIVSAELLYPDREDYSNLSVHDYKYNKVTIWPYVYDERSASKSGEWSSSDIEFIQKLCIEESEQPEVTKH